MELPKFIFAANLAGDNVMLYESGYSLLYQVLNVVTAPEQRQCVRRGVDAMVAFADEKENRSLLLVYSMPPMEEPVSMHWELRSVTVENGEVLDGARHFSRSSLQPCFGTPTSKETSEPTLLRAEVHALQNHIVAVSVDVGADATAETSSVDTNARETVLRNTISAMVSDRKQMVRQIGAMREERVENAEKERRMAREEVEREIEAARAAKRLSDKIRSEADSKLLTLRDELNLAKSQLKESQTGNALIELAHVQETEDMQRRMEAHDKDKKDLRSSRDRLEKSLSGTIRTMKVDYENLKFDSQNRVSKLEKQASELQRREKMNKEMHDRVVACMSGQDAEIEVLKSKLKERDDEVETLHTEVEKLKSDLGVVHSELEACERAREDSESVAKLAVATRTSALVVDAQERLSKAQLENALLKEQLLDSKTRKTCAREAQTTSTQGTDTYIDTAQRCKTTQTETGQDTKKKAVSVSEASVCAFEALEQLISAVYLPDSKYVAQSGVHPPECRYKIVKQTGQM
jgi:hypothetical protein